MNIYGKLIAGIVATQMVAISFAAEDSETVEALRRQIQELDQKVRNLRAKQELDKDADRTRRR